MAQPIDFQVSVKPARENVEELENAPAEHADALLSAYDLLQLLHDRGVLNLLRGMVGSGDELVGAAATALDKPESIRAIRNFLLLTQFFATIPPEILQSLVNTVSAGAKKERPPRPPGLFSLLWRLRNQDSRHALSVALDLLQGLGKGI